jgi:hypothetical protein
MKMIFLKEVIKPEGKKFSAFTALTDVLKSESLFHLYRVVWYAMRKDNQFQFGNIIIRKITLTHSDYGKTRKH